MKNYAHLWEEMEEVEASFRGTKTQERQSAPSLKISYKGDPGKLSPDDDVVAAKTWPDGSVTYLLRGGNIIYEERQ